MEQHGKFWNPNIDRFGRRARGIVGILLVLAGIGLGIWVRWWLGAIVFLSGAFALFEAARGWCFLRACGIKTRH